METQIEIGTRIQIKGEKGTIRYFGKVQTDDPKQKKANWYGVEWDTCERGKHSGQGLFELIYHPAGTICCSFIKEGKVPLGNTIEEALRTKYQSYESMTEEEKRRDIA